MKKKITALVLVIAVVAMLFTGMTLAYFTDTESAVNTFTVGKVDIEVEETVGVTDSDGNDAPDRVTQDENGATYTGIMPGNKLDKKVTVTNKDNPAYVRVVVIVNNHLETYMALDYNKETDSDYDVATKNDRYTEVFTNWGITFTDTAACGGVIPDTYLDGQGVEVLGIDTAIRITDYALFDDGNYIRSAAEQTDADEVLENYMDGQYAPHLKQYERIYVYYFAMDKGESVTLFDGLYCPTWFDQEAAEMFQGLNIEIYAAAIQQEGFATPEEAFAQLDLEYSISKMRGLN